jgi:hypothetical protein
MAALRSLFGRMGLGHSNNGDFAHAKKEIDLFPKTDPEIDGEECLHDCESCSVKYPAKFSIEESAHLYGHIKPFYRHLIVATDSSDWVAFLSMWYRQKDSLTDAKHDRFGMSVKSKAA